MRCETKITTKAGAERWITLTATTVEHAKKPVILWMVVDITAYKGREEALRRSEMRYRKVFEFAPEAFILYDPEGRAIDAYPEALKMFGGSSRDEIAGLLSVLETWCEEDRACFSEIREQTSKYGEWRGERKAYRKDGQVIDFDTRVKVADIEGETVVIAITLDITERKRMEEQLRNALLEKETLLREIHHRVKNNMQIISTLLKLQLRNTDDENTRALFRESQNRILSMAMIHEKLYQSEGLHKINLNDYKGKGRVEARIKLCTDAPCGSQCGDGSLARDPGAVGLPFPSSRIVSPQLRNTLIRNEKQPFSPGIAS